MSQELEFQQKVLTALGNLQSGQAVTNVRLDGIDEHLKSLNGAVARHERDLNSVKLKEAADIAVSQERNRTYARYVRPAVRIGGAILITLLAEHSHEIVKAVLP